MNEQMEMHSIEAEKFSGKKTIGYCAYRAAGIANSLLCFYVTYYATDSLFLSAASIGMVLAYVMMIAMFSVPGLPDTGKLIWIFITYNLNSSVCGTIYNVCEAKLLKRIIVKAENRVKTLTYAGIFMTILPMAISVVLPILIARVAGDAKQWSILALGLGAVGILLTVIAFALCKEYTKEELIQFGILKEAEEQRISLKDMAAGVVKNKYFLFYYPIL